MIWVASEPTFFLVINIDTIDLHMAPVYIIIILHVQYKGLANVRQRTRQRDTSTTTSYRCHVHVAVCASAHIIDGFGRLLQERESSAWCVCVCVVSRCWAVNKRTQHVRLGDYVRTFVVVLVAQLLQPINELVDFVILQKMSILYCNEYMHSTMLSNFGRSWPPSTCCCQFVIKPGRLKYIHLSFIIEMNCFRRRRLTRASRDDE